MASGALAIQMRPCSSCLYRLSNTNVIPKTRRCLSTMSSKSFPTKLFHYGLSHSRTHWISSTNNLPKLLPVTSSSFHPRANFSRLGPSQGQLTQTHSAKSSTRKPSKWILPKGYDTGISMYNSLTLKKEPLILRRAPVASWYSCGPTVYDKAHIGHASAYIRQDVIRRIMMNLFDIDVVMVMGVTDIDDKIIRRSNEMKVDFLQLARCYEDEFFSDMAALKVLPPSLRTRVTDFIPDIIDFVQRLITNGVAYRSASGSVYFDVNKYGKYGQLRTHSEEPLSREPETEAEKRSVRDFALWKAAKPGEPYWVSPWGKGRPGWHIECSTMAYVIFGEKLDIHSGGEDLRFPHHENEIAQSEGCFCCEQWTNYWMHTGHLHQKDQLDKMSKSLKNTISVSELLSKYTANQFRLFCMLRPYRKLVEYSDESMVKAVSLHKSWIAFIKKAEAYAYGQIVCAPINEPYLLQSLAEAKSGIVEALADDFDTPRALKILDDLIKKTNVELSRAPVSLSARASRSPGVVTAVAAYVSRMIDVFGLSPSNKTMQNQSEAERKLETAMDALVTFRSKVRNFALYDNMETDDTEMPGAVRRRIQRERMKPLFSACDDVRNSLNEQGITVEDLKRESIWSFQEFKIEDKSDVEESKILENRKKIDDL